MLHTMGYSLQVAKKKQAGAQHPDRDEQFKYIAALKAQFLEGKLPVVTLASARSKPAHSSRWTYIIGLSYAGFHRCMDCRTFPDCR
jgi:Rhodopirellula transposase DDE domain